MELLRIPSRTYLRIILVLVGVIIALFLLNKLHKRSQVYEGYVLDRKEVQVGWRYFVYRYHFIYVETLDGHLVKAEVTLCGRFSHGDYVVKARGYECPAVVQGARDMRTRGHLSDLVIPVPRKNPDLSHQLEEYETR